MSTVAFDTHTLFKKFKAAGFTEEQAEVTIEAVRDSIVANELLTKQDLRDLRVEIRELEIRLIKWVVGVGIAGILAIAGLLKLIH